MSTDIDNRSLEKGLGQIISLKGELDFSDSVYDDTLFLFKEVCSKTDLLGMHGVDIAAQSCVLLASRSNGSPIDAKTIAERSSDQNRGENEILSVAKKIKSELEINPITADPHDIVDQIGEKVDASMTIKKEVHALVRNLKHTHIVSGRKPESVAAGAFYLVGSVASPKRRGLYTQAEIAQAASIAQRVVRETYKAFDGYIDGEYDKFIDTQKLKN